MNSPGEFCDSTLLPIAMCVINLCTVGFIQIRLCFLNTLLLQCFDAVGHATGIVQDSYVKNRVNPPLIATEMIPAPIVSEIMLEQHTKSHEESE